MVQEDPLVGEVNFVRNLVNMPNIAELKGKRAAVIVYGYYPSDTRVHRSTEALLEAGMEVDLFCLRETARELPEEVVGGARVIRLALTHRRNSKLAYVWLYARFFLSAFWFLTRKGLGAKYAVVHVHNMPDVLVFTALLPKLRGAKVILDLHDPMPELMTSIYGLEPGNWKVGLLRLLERWSIAFSNLSVTPNIAFKDLFVTRSCRAEKMLIVMNTPDARYFDPDSARRDELTASPPAEFRIMHHGSIVYRHGIDQLVEAIATLRPKIPGLRLDIYGSPTPFLDTVLETARRLGVSDIVRYHGVKNQDEIAEAIQHCHLGVVPNRQSAFTDINFPTRLFEYLAMHRPVIAPDTPGIRDYFGRGQMIYFQPGNVSDLADRILWCRDHPEESREMARHGLVIYRQHLWSEEKSRFLNQVAQLCGQN